MQSLLTLVLSHVAVVAVISTQTGCTSNPFLAQAPDRPNVTVMTAIERHAPAKTDSSSGGEQPGPTLVQYQPQLDESMSFARKWQTSAASIPWYEGDSWPWLGRQSPLVGPDGYQVGATVPNFGECTESLASYMEPSLPTPSAPLDPVLDPTFADSANAEPTAAEPFPAGERRFARAWRRCRHWGDEVWGDYQAFYRWENLRDLFIGLGVASILANTSMDQDFRDWYQERVHTRGLNHVGYAWKVFGEGAIFIPSYAGLALLGAMYEDGSWGETVGEFGARAARGFLVGGPVVLAGQYVLGAARPASDGENSLWQPFHSCHAISGHAFVGPLPFITAGKMCENPWLKATLYGCSVLPAWSRVEHDRHYLSQAVLGWWIAYLACDAVDNTAQSERSYSIAPVASYDLVGVSFTYRL